MLYTSDATYLCTELPFFVQAAIAKVVDAWRKEQIFPEEALAHFRGFLGSNGQAVTHDVAHSIEQPPPAVTVGMDPRHHIFHLCNSDDLENRENSEGD